ncbi:MAG TPA: NUDIX domain-containing protein [Bacteroidales bacterium]
MNTKVEWFPLVDEQGAVIGKATRTECHSGSFLLHPVVHLHLFNTKGELYLQKRSMTKDIQPGKWDTAVGGHIDYGETVEEALYREVREEIAITGFTPSFLKSYTFRSNVEFELVHTFKTVCDTLPNPDPSELDDGRYWTLSEIEANLGKEVFTPNFESEYRLLFME